MQILVTILIAVLISVAFYLNRRVQDLEEELRRAQDKLEELKEVQHENKIRSLLRRTTQ